MLIFFYSYGCADSSNDQRVRSNQRVSISIEILLLFLENKLNFGANYTRGHSEIFHDCIKMYHPGILLFTF